MISTDPSRMYAALRNIEEELEKPEPSIERLREIMAEAKRKLDSRPGGFKRAEGVLADESLLREP